MEQIFYFIAELTVVVGIFYALKWYLKTHQNDLEKRLESYCPLSSLPEARQLYLTKWKRILKHLSTTVAIVFSLILFLFIGLCVDFGAIRQMGSVPYLLFGHTLVTPITTSAPYLLIIFYYLYYTINRTTQAQQLLLVEMNGEDSTYLEKVRQVSRLLYLLPPFMLCQEKLYFSKLTHIIEVSVTSITDVSAILKDKRNNITVFIEHSQRATLAIPSELYPFLAASMFKYRLTTGYAAEGQRGIKV